MGVKPKTAQLQIRVSAAEKAAIQRAAAGCGLDMSSYVLRRALPASASLFQEHVKACTGSDASFALAELNSFLHALTAAELRAAVAAPPVVSTSPFIANYVAAMVEYACGTCAAPMPGWTRDITALPEPYFGTSLLSLRLYLLIHSPAPFRRRNLFIDATLGDRI